MQNKNHLQLIQNVKRNFSCFTLHFSLLKYLYPKSISIRRLMSSSYEFKSWFVTGLVDAEGSFGVSIVKKSTSVTGYTVLVYFEIALNQKDRLLLEMLKETFNIESTLYFNKSDNTLKLKVSSIEKLRNIITHFSKYPLYTQKREDLNLFIQVLQIIREGRHLTLEGLNEILNIKSALNLGLSDNLKTEFSSLEIKPLTRKIVKPELPNFSWLAGFVEGEACFYVSVYNSPKSKLNYAVQLVFKITQHSRDVGLLNEILNLLKCGRVEVRKSGEACDFTVTSFNQIKNTLIPFLEKYPLKGQKLKEYQDFKRVYDIILTKGHLTQEGLNNIIQMKNGMNSKRI